MNQKRKSWFRTGSKLSDKLVDEDDSFTYCYAEFGKPVTPFVLLSKKHVFLNWELSISSSRLAAWRIQEKVMRSFESFLHKLQKKERA